MPIGRILGRVAKAALPVAKPFVRAIPGVGTAIAAYEVAQAVTPIARSAFGGGGARPPAPPPPRLMGAPPPPPMMAPPSRGIPMGGGRSLIPNARGVAALGGAALGAGYLASKIVPRGPGGGFQMPWNDPSAPAHLKPFALDDSALKISYRAPRGYVVVLDEDGRPYPLRRDMAIKAGAFTPAKKPPISVRDYEALKRADRTVRKMRSIYRRIARVDAGTAGKKVIVHSTKKKGR